MKSYLTKFADVERFEEYGRIDSGDWADLKYDLPPLYHMVCDLGARVTKDLAEIRRVLDRIATTEEKFKNWTLFSRIRSNVERVLAFCHKCVATLPEEMEEENPVKTNLENISNKRLATEDKLGKRGTAEFFPMWVSMYMTDFETFMETCIYDTLVELKGKELTNEGEMKRQFADVLKDKIKIFIDVTPEEEGRGRVR